MPDRPLTIGIQSPLVLKAGELCLVADQSGTVPANIPGMGLFYRDCRYLARYALCLHGREPLLLASSAALGFGATLQLTNRTLPGPDGRAVPAGVLGIVRRLVVFEENDALVDLIRLRNFDTERLELTLAMTFEARFEDVFALRGAPPGRRGTLCRPEHLGDALRFSYQGADGVLRRLEVAFSQPPVVAPRTAELTRAHIELELEPQQSQELRVLIRPIEEPADRRQAATAPALAGTTTSEAEIRCCAERWLDGFAKVRSDCALLDDAVQRSLADIRLLQIRRKEGEFIAGGVPWYLALLGRDAMIAALQCLAFRPELAASVLRTLARWQARDSDPRRRTQPGKIPHELRVGEMARLGEVPETPSYASIDSTLLFLILLARHADWTGSLALFSELRDNADRALAWLAEHGDADRDGYVDYDGGPEGELVNQGWKDSGAGIVRADGSLPDPPIALAEVQGYAYLAETSAARLYARAGDQATADRLNGEAQALRERFNRDFWMEHEGCYCLGLEKAGRPLRVVASNAGQVLWTGIADADKARRTALRLMHDDMFSGWGIRTLSSRASRFNPLAYHLGSVWPFDNALILAGLRRSGEDASALGVFSAMLDAAGHFLDKRLPEFFAGSAREFGSAPAHCPRADPVQAWSAGALPQMLTALLGLVPDGLCGRLVRPVLPAGVAWLDVTGVRIGQGTVDLHFERSAVHGATLTAPRIEGDIKVSFE